MIHDVWQSFECSNKDLCDITFADNDFSRDSIYYVRALQEPTWAINGIQIQTNSSNKDSEVNICRGSYKTDPGDDCLYQINERAWSSPIFLNKP